MGIFNFMAFFPIGYVIGCVEAMNEVVSASREYQGLPPFSFGELLMFLAFLIYASRFPHITHEELLGRERFG